MMDPKNNRFDYGVHLQPPPGYELDCAIATTYSLDLDTLLAVPVAMYFNDTLEGDLRGEKLALLEAVGQLKGRIKVFYQAGNIKLPPAYNRLFTLLEPWLQPVVPSGGEFSSFHSKLWLLRYKSADHSVPHYRLLVLSRNLTFDRSWDIAVALDGVLSTEKTATDPDLPWICFIRQLLESSEPLSSGPQFLDELSRIEWSAPPGFREPLLIAGGKEFGRPLQLDAAQDALLVVSPFLSKQALDGLAEFAPDDSRWLFSRAEELNILGVEQLKKWQCYSINELIVDGEERLALGDEVGNQQVIRPHELHAKIILTQRGNITHWHLGSANATNAALGCVQEDAPRNTEFMLRLTGPTKSVGPETLMELWVDDNDTGLFVKHEFSQLEHDESAGLKSKIRQLSHQLISASWCMKAETDLQGTFTLVLTGGFGIHLPDDLSVEIGQLAIDNAYQPLASEMRWSGASLSQISALIPVRILVNDLETVEQLVIQVSLTLPRGTEREQMILRQLIDSDDKFFNYIRLLLQQQPDKQEWLGYDTNGRGGEGLSYLFDQSPVFEQLMEAAAKHRQSLKRIEQLLERLKDTGVTIPAQFEQLWGHFRNNIG